MDYGIELVERQGNQDPVSLSEAKANLRVLHSDEDARIEELVTVAAEHLEDTQGRVLRKAKLTMTLDAWPGGDAIRLPRWPVQSVESVKYLKDGEGSFTTFDASKYRVDTRFLPPRVVLKKDELWPTDVLESGAPIEVTFIAGYEDGQVPAKAKQAMHLLIGHLYENREAVITGTIATELPLAFESLALSERLW